MSILSRSVFRWSSLLCLSLVIVSAAWAGEYRTWTDSTGKHKLRAKLESVEDDKAILLRDNGEKMTIEIDKLSKADRDFIAKQNPESPIQAAEDPTDEPAEKASKSSGGGSRTVTVDWSNSQAIPPMSSQMEWNVTAPDAPAADFRPKSVSLPAKKDFFDKMTGMAVSRVAKAAVVGYDLKKPGSQGDSSIRVLLCDLQTGRVTATGSTTGENMAPMALHDDGRQILMCRNEFGHAKHDRLEIWTVQGKKIARSLIWSPYEGEGRSGQDVSWAEFIDAKRLATCSSGGKVAIWNLATGQPICHFFGCNGTIPALSHDRKWIAFAEKETVNLFNVEKQEIIASQKIPGKTNFRGPALAFSPSGRKIGCLFSDRILVWDTASGQLDKDITFPGLPLHGTIDFPDEDFILGNKQYLIELKNQLKLWHYLAADRVCTVRGTTFMATAGHEGAGLLLATKLPHPEATALLKKALLQPDLFVFHKGTPVKLDVSGIPDPAEQTKAAEALTKKLKELDCPIGPTGEVDVVALVEGPKPDKITFLHSGTYQVQEYITRLKFVYQGQTIWETCHTNIPIFLRLKKGENVGDELRKASENPAYGLYQTVVLPTFLQKPSDNSNKGLGQTLGTSQVTAQGLR